MRETTFRKPGLREVLSRGGIDLPKRINEKFVLGLVDSRNFIFVENYTQAVDVLDDISFEDDKFVLFPSEFRVGKKESDYGIKSLRDLIKIDSQPIIRKISKNRFSNLTKECAEACKIWPYTLIKQAMKKTSPENPATGFYWGNKATTWLRAITGAEMEFMKQKGDFKGEILDKKPYGRNLRVRVNSRTADGFYEFTLSRLPMHKRGDIKQYSDWINLSHDSADPDAAYRGEEHEKRKLPICFWSASTIFSFYEAMKFVGQHPSWKQFRINPFPIPTDKKMIDFVDKLRLKSLILDKNDGKLSLGVLNKTEMDKSIGARTRIRGYDGCWHHWGKKDLSYLYQK